MLLPNSDKQSARRDEGKRLYDGSRDTWGASEATTSLLFGKTNSIHFIITTGTVGTHSPITNHKARNKSLNLHKLDIRWRKIMKKPKIVYGARKASAVR
jgi:hypothetical protein